MTGISPDDFDTSPPLNTLFPGNCRIKGCHLHCFESENNVDPNDSQSISILEHHGRTYHSDLLHTTPSTTLSQISWYKCVIGCTHLSFTLANLRAHQLICKDYKTSITSTSRTNTQSPQQHQPTQPSVTSTQHTKNITHLRSICPQEFINEFDHAVKKGRSIRTLTTMIMAWMTETSSHTTRVSSKKND